MPRITLGVNLDDVESGYTTIPAGTYLMKVKSAKATKSKSSNLPVIRWSHVVVEPEEFAGKMIADPTSLSDDALWRLKQLLEATGVSWDEEGFDPDDAVDCEFVAEITIEIYEDQPRSKVTAYYKVGERQPKVKEEEA